MLADRGKGVEINLQAVDLTADDQAPTPKMAKLQDFIRERNIRLSNLEGTSLYHNTENCTAELKDVNKDHLCQEAALML